MASFLNPVNSLIATGQSFQEMRTSMERINDVMRYEPDVKEDEAPDLTDVKLEKLGGAVELKNVTFGYSRLAAPVIKDFSMTLAPGSKVAFIGSSGCGKSTLAKLISGLYEPWEGEILFDGKRKKDIPRSVFTGSLAVVDQDIILFEDSVSNNIKMWDGAIEDFEMILAARDAQMHEDIMLREGGYDCPVAEGGRNFSGGQRQRFEIARVLAQDPTVVILDEATSALDAKTEYEVTKAIKDRGVTCIIIAHRLSTIRDCDEIIVMDKGVAVERGSHDELYKVGGLYTKLITME
jgi:ABC-type bacteriocin/lantibiotic exporter with double-glycine peptidase domain